MRQLTKAEQDAVRKLAQGGHIETAWLIEAARDPSHPCHKRFTWDVKRAAEERWHDQARAIIRQVVFEVQVEEATQSVCEYVPSSDKEERQFVSLPRMRKKADTVAMLRKEVAMLHGVAARVYGIASTKEKIVGSGVVAKIKAIRNQAAAVKGELAK